MSHAPENSSTLLRLEKCSIRFGGLTAVSELTAHIGEHELIGLIGPNGAGKTTVFNLITGVYQPTAGQIFFCGESLPGHKPHKITAKGIARTFQNIRLFNDLSVLDNIAIAQYGRTTYGLFEALLHVGG